MLDKVLPKRGLGKTELKILHLQIWHFWQKCDHIFLWLIFLPTGYLIPILRSGHQVLMIRWTFSLEAFKVLRVWDHALEEFQEMLTLRIVTTLTVWSKFHLCSFSIIQWYFNNFFSLIKYEFEVGKKVKYEYWLGGEWSKAKHFRNLGLGALKNANNLNWLDLF